MTPGIFSKNKRKQFAKKKMKVFGEGRNLSRTLSQTAQEKVGAFAPKSSTGPGRSMSMQLEVPQGRPQYQPSFSLPQLPLS
jgi:hypothetical protein